MYEQLPNNLTSTAYWVPINIEIEVDIRQYVCSNFRLQWWKWISDLCWCHNNEEGDRYVFLKVLFKLNKIILVLFWSATGLHVRASFNLKHLSIFKSMWFIIVEHINCLFISDMCSHIWKHFFIITGLLHLLKHSLWSTTVLWFLVQIHLTSH